MSPADLAPMPEGPATPAAALIRLATAYQASRALHVAAELGLADLVAEGPLSSQDLAARTGTDAPSLHRLLRALAAFGVFGEGEDGRFGLAPAGETLRRGVRGSVRDLILMFGHADFWGTWGELGHCVRTGGTAAELLFGPGDSFARYAATPGLAQAFDAGMTVVSATVAGAVTAAYDFSGHSRVVDVGGGQGRLIAAILQANPRLRGVLFDLPGVVAGAARVLAEAGVADRCEVVGGDMFAAVPGGGDVYVLSRVLHDWDDERAIAILANCRRAMSGAAARLLLIERVPPDGVDTAPATQAMLLSDLNMLVRTGGRERTKAEYGTLLGVAGLRLSQVMQTDTQVSLVVAEAA